MPGEKMPECVIVSGLGLIRTKEIVKIIKVRFQE
jgi:hypothetical protein